MVIGATFQFKGIPELQQKLDGLKTGMTGDIAKRTMEMSMNNAKKTAQQNVHKVSGDLQRSIQTRIQGNRGVLFSNLRYALKEEKRIGGPKGPSHKYIEPAWQAQRKAWPELYLKELRRSLMSGRR